MIYAVQLWQEGRPTAVAHRPIIRFQPQTANKPTNKQHNTVSPPAVGDREQIRKWLGDLLVFIEGDLKENSLPPWMIFYLMYHRSVTLSAVMELFRDDM